MVACLSCGGRILNLNNCEYIDGSGVKHELTLEAPLLMGRRLITTNADEITIDNVKDELNHALMIHAWNAMEEEYLYWYRRGYQPILTREKEIRPEINNKVVENHAEEIVQFKNGYFLTQPAVYISRREDEAMAAKVKELNEYLYQSGKHTADTKAIDWAHTVGVGAVFCEPRNDKRSPLKVYALDPRNSFVVYSSRPGNKPMFGVNIVQDAEDNIVFDVFSDKWYFKLLGGRTTDIHVKHPIEAIAYVEDSVKPNVLGRVPIVEYHYNLMNMSAFEAVIPLLDAINAVQSNRLDGIEQFIQSLAIAVNCDFDDGVTANDIRKAGMIVLKSVGENRADFKVESDQLNQSQTQILVNYLYQQVLTITGLPATTKGGTSTSDTGVAVLARDGWYQADNQARNTADLFIESNRLFDDIFVEALRRIGFDIDTSDFEVQIAHNETSNLLTKTQGALNLKELGLAPEIVLSRSGVSNDPVADVAASKIYIEKAWGMNSEGELIPTRYADSPEAQEEQNSVNSGGKSDWVQGYYRNTQTPDNRK